MSFQGNVLLEFRGYYPFSPTPKGEAVSLRQSRLHEPVNARVNRHPFRAGLPSRKND
ncbi:MAG TPA: hypothetical protein PK530_10720 [Anaerolineales bacterium]|nr:hypothetical protein [Anaerolineales bacterium]